MSSKRQKQGKGLIVAHEASAQALALSCPDLDHWAQSWLAEESDLVPGQRIVEFFKPFLLHLLAQGLVSKTVRQHYDHLWMLGGEVIRRRQENSHLRRLPVEKVTFALLEEDGGPLIWPRITESEQDAFDATCRKLYRFFTVPISTDGD
jgi:hypothetical protein